MIEIAVANQQTAYEVDETQLRTAILRVLQKYNRPQASISLAVVDNPTIHELNKQFLQHDYATDVLSFVLDDGPEGLDGEVIVNAEMAAEQAARYDWSAENELLLYVIHGTLHLVGLDDKTPEAAAQMRIAEKEMLAELGLELGDSSTFASSPAGDSLQ